MAWRFESACEIGGRAEQQDRVAVLSGPGWRGDHLVILADGMGGQRHGAEAAQAVVDSARRQFFATSITNPREFLTNVCRLAHQSIKELGRQQRSNPGSTCVLLYVRDAEAYWTHVGDSRLYHFAGADLLFRTRDHRLAELRKNAGAPASGDPGEGPLGHALYSCLGGKNEMQSDFGASAVGRSHWFMLCSDGFWSNVHAEEVAGVLSACPQERDSAAKLASLAARRGGATGDNVSLVLAIQERSRLKSFWRRLASLGMGSRR